MNGDVKCKKDLELPVSGGVGVGYGLVLIGKLKGEVVALDSSTGEEKWRARVTSEVLAAPATNGDVVVVQTQDDRLIGLDASTGNQRWLYDNTPLPEEKIDSTYRRLRWQIFAGIFFGYAGYYLLRKNFSLA
ncbi:outer membrane protein assembly factor BamB family protein, partial [Klebsiella pneumoniae]|uniref:outer membrane protein assembly factor BamB family protein n=1 Tax=Klebsiella pneumoniae TaxID=573 RepID=UPI00272F0688